MVTRRTERAQVLLIAAVVLALTILMLAVLLNTAVLTEVRSPDDPSTDAVEAERLGTDVETGATELVAHMNAMNHTDGGLETVFENTFETYGEVLFESVGERRATHINVSPVTIKQRGRYVSDTDRNTDLTVGNESLETRIDSDVADASLLGMELSLKPDTLDEGSPNDSTPGIRIIRKGETSDTCAGVDFTKTGDPAELEIQDADCGVGAIEGDSKNCGAGTWVTVSISRHPPEEADACHLNPFDDFDPVLSDGLEVKIINADEVVGGYHFAVSDKDAVVEQDLYSDPFEEGTPYTAPIVWEATVATDQWARASDRSSVMRLTPYEDFEYFDLFGNPWV